MDFIRNIGSTFKENLDYAVSWRVDFAERISYNIKGDAKRSFFCDLHFISLDKNHFFIKPMVDAITILSSGWLKLDV